MSDGQGGIGGGGEGAGRGRGGISLQGRMVTNWMRVDYKCFPRSLSLSVRPPAVIPNVHSYTTAGLYSGREGQEARTTCVLQMTH